MRLKITIACLVLLISHVLHAGISVTNGLSHTFRVEPGKIYSGKICIQNVGSTIEEVELKKTDLGTQSEGTYLFSDSINPFRSNRNWIIINPTKSVINPNQFINIEFEIKVPADKTLRGTYWSVIMLEPTNTVDSSSLNPGVRILTTTRYAIQIICNFNNAGIGSLEFQNPGLNIVGNTSFFDFTLVNKGEHLISPIASMELFDVSTGESVKVLKIPVKRIYPTTSKRLRFQLEGLPKDKPFKAMIVADGSGDDVFGMEYTIVQ